MASNFCFAWDRNPAWKWDRANKIIGGTQTEASIELDSENGAYWINRAVEFKRIYDANPDPLYNPELISSYGDIYTAHSIHLDSSLFRSELEALVLAAVEPEELAVEAGVKVSAITAYEELFFDVREKLDNKMYILHHVIGPAIQNLSKKDNDIIWKLFGYCYGPEMVRALASRTVNPQVCATPDTVEAAMESDVIKSIKLASMIAAKHPDGGDRSQKRLMETFSRFMEIDKMEDFSQGSDQAQVWRHVLAMMNSLSFSVGMQSKEDGTQLKKSPIVKYLQSPVDLTHDEIIDIAVTGEAPEAESVLNLKYPPPPPKRKKNA